MPHILIDARLTQLYTWLEIAAERSSAKACRVASNAPGVDRCEFPPLFPRSPAGGANGESDADRRRCPSARKVPRIRAGRAVCWPTPACTCRACWKPISTPASCSSTDLGTASYLAVLDAEQNARAPTLMRDALDALIRWQLDLARRRAAAVRRSVPAPRDGADARVVHRRGTSAARSTTSSRDCSTARSRCSSRARWRSRRRSCCATSCRAI